MIIKKKNLKRLITKNRSTKIYLLTVDYIICRLTLVIRVKWTFDKIKPLTSKMYNEFKGLFE